MSAASTFAREQALWLLCRRLEGTGRLGRTVAATITLLGPRLAWWPCRAVPRWRAPLAHVAALVDFGAPSRASANASAIGRINANLARDRRRAAELLGDTVICNACGATVATYEDVCTSFVGVSCDGSIAVDTAYQTALRERRA